MQTLRELTYPVQLTSIELFALLSLVSAPGLLGVEVKSPQELDEAQAIALWEQGSNELRQHGWLVDDPSNQTSAINEELLLLIITAVNAEVVLLSTWQQASGQKYSVAYYDHGATVVEMRMIDGLYEFTALASRAQALQRFVRRFEPAFPQIINQPITFQLTQEQAMAAKQNPDQSYLAGLGLSTDAAQTFAESLNDTLVYGTIDLIRSEATHILTNRAIGIMIAANTAWLGFVSPDGVIDYSSVGEADVINLLDQEMTNLAEIKGADAA
ncbi:hypothetical protein [Herpetosiphon geysericola]|uniref:Uncharacterized protein n=1 Tax=Herpetosiphon geysericola TaxID=70996 RepID=A0A0P6YLG5_9CHLR|nr:hypothetical protein [Herpetosiphon geysericola]KPL86100.1 hypothetical protein SE18_14615 [Herpetosiphon geysericola]